jgi:hypothetical protein
MQNKDLEEKIKEIVIQQLRYIKSYIGKVIDVEDPLKRGRVKCYVLELGWIDGESSIWINPRYTKSMLKLKNDDYVKIGFMNGDRTRAYYEGMIQELKEMYPENYDGTKQVLFESNEKHFYITYDDVNKELYAEIGDNKYTINTSGVEREDVNGNKEEFTSSGMKRTDANGNVEEFTATGMKWTDLNGKTIETTATLLKFLGATEAFMKGTTWQTNWATFAAAIAAITPAGSSAGNIASIQAAFATFAAQLSNMLSTTIKGE